jgi:hypothetical protein
MMLTRHVTREREEYLTKNPSKVDSHSSKPIPPEESQIIWTPIPQNRYLPALPLLHHLISLFSFATTENNFHQDTYNYSA